MESEGSNNIYRKGKLECLRLALLPNCEFIIKGEDVLSTKAQGYLCII
jgi:hypothetical protein